MINHSDLFDKYFSMSKTQAIQQEKPIAILTVGQESAGKEVITAQAQDELSHRGGSILIDPSLITVADPQQNEDEKSKKISELIDKASSDKYNLVINQEYKDENEIDKLSKSLKDKGYEIDVRSISAPQEIIDHRESTNKIKDIEENIEKSASSILHEDKTGSILKHLEATDHIDKISIYDRVGNEVYSNEKNPDGETWLKQKEAYNIYNFEKK
jgi:deoxyxylulose-5-phosphate synthase